MNALKSYSSDDNSEDEGDNYGKQSGGVNNSSGDHGTNYDDVGMDISEEESGAEDGSSPSSHRRNDGGAKKSSGCRGDGKDSTDLHSRDVRRRRRSNDEDHYSGGSDDNYEQKKDDKNYSSLQERLLGLAAGKCHNEALVSKSSSHRHDDRRVRGPEDKKGSNSPQSLSSREYRHAKGSNRSSRRSRSPGHRRRSRSRERRSRSRDRRSRSRDRRSRSRERRDRRRRSRSRDRDRRRDFRRENSSASSNAKPGLLPLPTPPTVAHPPPLLATPPVPPLPSYYNPNSVNALKYAEQERKKKLLWGSKSAGENSTSPNAVSSALIPGLLPNPTSPPCLGGTNPGALALLGLNRSNPTGRALNLGLGKNQFNSIPGGHKELPGNKSSVTSPSSSDDSGAKKRPGMTDLWSTTTFSNDQDGKMAEKFKRLMGVKNSGALNSGGMGNSRAGSSAGEKLTAEQEDMFSNMERQYEVARQATHTHKGFGLGFTSSSYLSK